MNGWGVLLRNRNFLCQKVSDLTCCREEKSGILLILYCIDYGRAVQCWNEVKWAVSISGEAWSGAALSKHSQVEDKMWISDALAALVQESRKKKDPSFSFKQMKNGAKRPHHSFELYHMAASDRHHRST